MLFRECYDLVQASNVIEHRKMDKSVGLHFVSYCPVYRRYPLYTSQRQLITDCTTGNFATNEQCAFTNTSHLHNINQVKLSKYSFNNLSFTKTIRMNVREPTYKFLCVCYYHDVQDGNY